MRHLEFTSIHFEDVTQSPISPKSMPWSMCNYKGHSSVHVKSATTWRHCVAYMQIYHMVTCAHLYDMGKIACYMERLRYYCLIAIAKNPFKLPLSSSLSCSPSIVSGAFRG